MYVSSISIDRFGSWNNLSLQPLAGGLNVVLGPPRSGKSTLASFLRAMFGGFDAGLRGRFLVPTSRGYGGSVTLQTDEGRHTVTRYDDGSPEGRLTVQRPDGAIIGWRHLHDLLGDFPAGLLDKAYCVDFDRRPELSDLLHEAHRCGLPVVAGEAPAKVRTESESAVAGAAQRLDNLRRQVATLERALSELQLRCHDPVVEARPVPPASLAIPHRLTARLQRIEAQLRRWKKTLRDVVARRRRREELAERRPIVRRADDYAASRPRRVLRSLEQRLADLQRQVEQLSQQSAGHCQCASWQSTMPASLRQLAQEVYTACNALSCWQARQRQRQAAAEGNQLARCESELRRTIRVLRRRRQAILRKIDAERPAYSLHPEHGRFCECAAHPAPDFVAASRAPRATAGPTAQRAVATEIHRLANERLSRLAEIARTELELAELKKQQTVPSAAAPNLTAMAGDYLRRLSVQAYRGMCVSCLGDPAGSYQVVIEDSAGRTSDYRDLPSGTKDQVYLAFCLAVSAAGAQRGWRLPLVLNAAFTDFPSRHIDEVLSVLRSCGSGQQILCLTRHEHVSDVARRMDIPVYQLSSPGSDERPSSEAPPADLVRLGGRSTPPAMANPREEPFQQLSSLEADYLLHEHDPIERSPSLDEQAAVRLRQHGIARVGDLLRISTADMALDLRGLGITLEMLETWQAQARLMCELRGLRPYDARILVACGIRSAEQLVRMQPGALRARVHDLSATPHGQTVMLSGTEGELSRVTDWIGAARSAVEQAARLRVNRLTDMSEGDVAYPPPLLSDGHHEVAERARRSRTGHRRYRERRTGSEQASRRHRDGHRAATGAEVPPEVEQDAVVALPGPAAVRRFYLQPADSIEAAPSIGQAMARRLQAIGLLTVADLLQANPETVAPRLAHRRIERDTVQRWQWQSELVCCVPGLRGHDAQLLVAAGITSPAQLAAATAEDLLRRVQQVAGTVEGKRVLRGGQEPDLAEVMDWIHSAGEARTLRAA